MKSLKEHAINRNDNIAIAVVCGGSSSYAKLSRFTGQCIADALRVKYKKVEVLELDAMTGANLKKTSVDVVFPALYGAPGEGGVLQGFLDVMKIPYVGSGASASSRAMDRISTKRILSGYGLPVAKDVIVIRRKDLLLVAKHALDALGGDVVIKPSLHKSVLEFPICSDATTLEHAIEQAFAHGHRVLIEERIQGREIKVGILESSGAKALPVIEVQSSQSWLDFECMYTSGCQKHIIPAPLPDSQYRRTQELAIEAHRVLGCRDLSIVKFIVPDHGEPVVIEVKTMPGMTPTSLYAEAAKADDISFEELVSHLIERALLRI